MANKILLKRRFIDTTAPTTSQLGLGEVALNILNSGGGKLYFKCVDSDGSSNPTIVSISADGHGSVKLNNVLGADASTTRDHGANSITWRWALNGSDTALKLTESAAATGTNNVLFHVHTLAGSTATTFKITTDTQDRFIVAGNGNVEMGFAGSATGGFVAVNGTTGAVNIEGRDGTSSGASVTVAGGEASAGAGGHIQLTAGNATGGNAGNVELVAGSVASAHNAGNILITSGSGTALNGNAGNITLTLGTPHGTGTNGAVRVNVRSAGTFAVDREGVNAFAVDANNNVIVGNAALATSATNGFLYITTSAGTPTGTPTTITGRSPIHVDATNHRLYFYSGGQWRDATADSVSSVDVSGGSSGLTFTGGPINSTGTITLSGGTLAATYGGTGFSSYTTGDILYASSATALSKLAAAAAGNVLLSGTTPSWGKVGLASHVAGILPVANGGTGLGASSVADGQLLIGNDTTNGFDLATLTAGTGISVTNGAGSITIANTGVVSLTLTTPAEGLRVNDTTSATAPPASTFALTLANDLAAIEAMGSTGLAVRTGTDTWANRTLTSGTSATIVVGNGNGVSGNPTFDLATVADSGTGTFLKFTRDTYGRVTGTTSVVASDITGLVDSVYVNASGDTMTGNLIMSDGATVTGLPTPVNASDAANKAYVDAATSGLTWKNAVRVATTGNVNLTGGGLAAGTVIDGVTLVTGDRVLVKNQTTAAENGIYIVPASGAASRASDMDAASEFSSAAVFVQEGSTYADTGWTQVNTVTTLGTDPVNWVQFSGSNTYVAGTGLLLTGNTFSVNLGAGIFELPTDEIGIDLYDTTNGAIILTTDGSTRSTATGAKLHLLLNGSSLTQGASGLSVAAAGITETHLSTSVAGPGLVGGNSTPLSVNVDNVTLEIVTDTVAVKDNGITNAKLRDSTGLSVIGRAANTTGDPADITGTANQVLRVDSAGNTLGFGSINLASSAAVGTSVLGATNGGTGQNTYATGDLLYASAANTLSKLAIGTEGYILKVVSGVPAWSDTIDGGSY